MVVSLLSTYGFEVDVFSGAINVMHEDIRNMEREHRRLRLEGSRVSSIMRKPLRKVANGSYGSQKGRVLQLGDRGDAVFSDGGSMKQNVGATVGLGGALHRLRSRRVVRDEFTTNETPWDRAHSGLDMMPVTERLYNEGESSEAADYGERLIGVLGDAEHYGSFR
jgi:hypothetical protein